MKRRGGGMNMKKRICGLILALCLLLSLCPSAALAAETVNSGECGAEGETLTWTLDEDGVLTISGSGDMADFDEEDEKPWADDWERISEVIVEEGVRKIGNGAFSYLTGLIDVTLPVSMEKIGESAFDGCDLLEKVLYSGSEEDWDRILIGASNDPLINAEIIFSYDPASELYAYFDSNDERGIVESMLCIDGILVFPECIFSPLPGYVFKAWQVDDQEYEPGDEIFLTQDVLVLAIWIPASTSPDISATPTIGDIFTDDITPTPTDAEGDTLQPFTTATPTPKSAATPAPKPTATPTPKPTATPTPKPTATPTLPNTATPKPRPSGDGSGPVGSSVQYQIKIRTDGNGTASSSLSKSIAGNRVIITLTPNQGYEALSISVYTDAGVNVSTSRSGSGYSFVMPGDNVTVNVSFTLIKATSPAPLTPTPGDAGGGKEEEWRKSIMPDFGDITRDYWCYDEIEWAYQEGLMLGTSEDKYQPEKYISSATAVVVLSRMEKVDPKNFENLSYSQVPRGKWFTGQANWAKSRNLLPDSLYVTDEAILSRGEMALILLNYLKFKGKDCNIYSRVDFPDADLMSPAENDAFQVLYRYKIFLGVENRRMNVDKPTTRAHLAALLHRLYYVVS